MRPWGPQGREGPWDAVVLGAGMGGLSTAALLAKLGQRVLVLEQHQVPGGYTQSFRRGQWAWDVGLHVVGEMGSDDPLGRVLSRLTDGALQWTRVRGAYDVLHFPDGTTLDIPGGMTELAESLCAAFPDERAAIAAYLRQVRLAAAGMRDHFIVRAFGGLHRKVPTPARSEAARRLALCRTGEVIDGLTANPRLRAVLRAQWGFYGSPPERSAFGVHALLCRHFRKGGFYPHGGARALGEALARTVVSGGGWVRTQSPVSELLCRGGRIHGVKLASGEEIVCPTVVSAVGVLNTTQLLPEAERGREWVRSVQTLPSSCTHLSLNIGFRGDVVSGGATQANHWLMADWDLGLWDLGPGPPTLYVSFPSLKDGGAGDRENHSAEVVALTRWEHFARWAHTRWRQRDGSYAAFKHELADRMLARLIEKMPGLAPRVAFVDLSTPLSAVHFTRAPSGATYGLEATPERLNNPWLRPRVPLPGLHLAGVDVAAVGVAGALASGVAAALSISPARAWRWLRQALR